MTDIPIDDPGWIIDFLEGAIPPCEDPVSYLLCIIGRTTGIIGSEESNNPTTAENPTEDGGVESDIGEPSDVDDEELGDSDSEEEDRTLDDLSEGAKDTAKTAGSCYFRHCIMGE